MLQFDLLSPISKHNSLANFAQWQHLTSKEPTFSAIDGPNNHESPLVEQVATPIASPTPSVLRS